MKNLESNNVYRDQGVISIYTVKEIEKLHNIILPSLYTNFISKHNGARLNIDYFDYFDVDINDRSSNSIAFIPVQKIDMFIGGLSNESINDPDYFPKSLIPFGDNGGGDFICFDYRNHNGNNPPIIMWAHDVYDNSKRVSFIANNFEEFINMLYEPDEE